MLKCVVFVSLLSIVMHKVAYCSVYPWVWMGREDIQVITDPFIEAEFRLQLVRNAQESIDLVTFDQRGDIQVGLPFLREIENAAARGVKIRFASSWLATVLKDINNKSGKFMRTVISKYPNVEFAQVGGQSMKEKGWGYLDGIHEKLLIIDKKIILVTGRGHAGEYLKWLDTAFVFKGPLVPQGISAFQEMWERVLMENGLARPTPYNYISDKNSGEGIDLNSLQIAEVERLLVWSKASPTLKEEMKTRLLHHDLLKQIREKVIDIGSTSYEERIDLIDDPFLNAVMARLPSAKEFKMTSLVAVFPPIFKKALFQELRRGLRFELFTNSERAHSNIAPVPFGVGWYSGLPDLEEILQQNGIAYELDARGGSAFNYLHRKVAIIDNVVFFGSHNLTFASSYTQDEVSFEVEDEAFAATMRAIFEESVETNGTLIDLARVKDELESSTFKLWMGDKFKWIYSNPTRAISKYVSAF